MDKSAVTGNPKRGKAKPHPVDRRRHQHVYNNTDHPAVAFPLSGIGPATSASVPMHDWAVANI